MRSSVYIQVLVIAICLLFQACSFRMEKRRYRPGYHIETHGKTDHQKSYTSVESRQPSKTIEKNESEVQHFYSSNRYVKKDSLVTLTRSSKKKESVINKRARINNPLVFKQKFHHHSRVLKKVLDDHPKGTKEDNKKRRRAWAWGIGAVGIAAGLTGILVMALVSSYFAINLLLGAICIAIGLIFMTIALIVRFAGYKNLPDVSSKTGNPTKNGKAGFIMGIINASLALICFIFSFLISPFGIVAFSIAVPVIASAIVGFILGLTGLKSPDIKTTLGIILGVLAIILAIVAMAIVFI